MIAAAIQPFDPAGIVAAAVLNPVVIVAALWLGWQADQWQKLIVAGFAAACLGALAIWVATALDLVTVRGYGGVSGVFAVSFVYGVVLAALTFGIRNRTGSSR